MRMAVFGIGKTICGCVDNFHLKWSGVRAIVQPSTPGCLPDAAACPQSHRRLLGQMPASWFLCRNSLPSRVLKVPQEVRYYYIRTKWEGVVVRSGRWLAEGKRLPRGPHIQSRCVNWRAYLPPVRTSTNARCFHTAHLHIWAPRYRCCVVPAACRGLPTCLPACLLPTCAMLGLIEFIAHALGR